MPGNTIRLHRVLRATPEKVYRAFLDPDVGAWPLPPPLARPSTSMTIAAVSPLAHIGARRERWPCRERHRA